jgi:thiol:disulfide interchange protein DsbA
MMLRRLLAPALVLFSLTACAKAPAPAPAALAPAPVATVAVASATAANVAAASTATVAAASTVAAAAEPAAAPASSLAAAVAAQAAPAGFVPRPGTDFIVLPQAQPTWAPGKIEIAEVFSYRCIHCAEFQPKVNAWKKTMPADARWEYVPAVFGGSWDAFARAYFAAQLLGVQPQTHDKVFQGVFVDRSAGEGTVDDIAKMYAKWGVDQAKMLATMNSFGVTAKLNRAHQFAVRAGVDATPTIIINGKYRVPVTADRGFDGMLATTSYLIAQERAAGAAAKPAAKPAAAPAKKG